MRPNRYHCTNLFYLTAADLTLYMVIRIINIKIIIFILNEGKQCKTALINSKRIKKSCVLRENVLEIAEGNFV